MNENLNPERDSLSNDDLEFDKALRPQQFDDFRYFATVRKSKP